MDKMDNRTQGIVDAGVKKILETLKDVPPDDKLRLAVPFLVKDMLDAQQDIKQLYSIMEKICDVHLLTVELIEATERLQETQEARLVQIEKTLSTLMSEDNKE